MYNRNNQIDRDGDKVSITRNPSTTFGSFKFTKEENKVIELLYGDFDFDYSIDYRKDINGKWVPAN